MLELDSHAVYERLRQDREPFLQRARECASFTIPALQPPNQVESGINKGQKLNEPWQSFGARAVNNLTSKLALAVMPIGAKFFRMAIDEGALEDLRSFEQSETEVEESLALVEDMVLDKIEGTGLRSKIGMALRFVEISGNALLHIPANRAPRLFRLDSFVIERDPRDHVLQVVVRERVSPQALNEKLKARLRHLGVDTEDPHNRWIEVYTRVRRDTDGKGEFVWREWQEVNNKRLDKVITHEFHRNPYIHVRGSSIDGESYGRSHCEEYLGDLRALDALSRGIQQGTAQMAKTIWGVARNAPAGLVRKLVKAPNGGFVVANEGDVWPINAQAKSADFSNVRQEILDLKRDIGMAFLMNSTVPRNAERVTAEEIRLVASELDDTLGGIFTRLGQDLQLPTVNVILGNMIEAGEIDRDAAIPFKKGKVRPVIVTGLDAIGRGHDLRRLDEFISGSVERMGPEILNFINPEVYLRARAVALGINTEQLIKSREQIEEEQQQQQMQAAAEQMGPELLKKLPPEALAEAAQSMGPAQVPA